MQKGRVLRSAPLAEGGLLCENEYHWAEAHCGLSMIDLGTDDLVDWLWLQGIVRELYDVVVLPGVRRPLALGFKTDEIRRPITMGASA